MGASGWNYFVPYHDDIELSLSQLRNQIFKEKKYYQPAAWLLEMHELNYFDEDGFDEAVSSVNRIPDPRTIEELINQAAETGTHSILDINGISDQPNILKLSPLTGEEKLQIFGTEYPSIEQAKREIERLQKLRGSWQGVYQTLYVNGKPNQILYAGCSGD
jgi:hypothetical protein